MVEKKCQSNAKISLCLPQRPLGHLRILQNRDAPEAIALVTATIAPQSLSELQINVLQRAWNKQSYHQILLELNHEYSYIEFAE
jgi:hypothetical protein